MMSLKQVLSVAVILPLVLAGCGGCEREERPGEEGPAGAPVAAPATKPPAAEAEQVEVDCFVIVDAEPDFGPPPLTVNFVTEIDCTGSPVTYRWDFGDGTTGGSDPNPTHVYEKPGDYVATVTATAPDGGLGDDDIDITVEESAE